MGVVLTPKVGGDLQDISYIELLWKSVEIIINYHLKDSIKFHDALHRFNTGRGVVNAIIEAKILLQISFMHKQALYNIFKICIRHTIQ